MKPLKKSEFFTIRIPNDLIEQVQPIAEQEERSVNQQCVYLIRQGLKSLKNDDIQSKIEALEQSVAELQSKV